MAHPLRVICITMQRDERLLLEPWIVYHGYLFGYSNLHIIDNGSTDPIIRQIYRKYPTVHVIRSYTSRKHFERKGDIVQAIMTTLAYHGDIFIPLDCDEFFAIRLADRVTCDRQKILQYLQTVKGDKNALWVNQQLTNIPSTRSGLYSMGHCQKTFFAAGRVTSLDVGYHKGTTGTGKETLTPIVYFHYHFKPWKQWVESAKNKLSGRIPDFSHQTLLGYRGKGDHLVKHLLMTEKEYNNSFPLEGTTDTLVCDELTKKLHELGTSIPF